MSSEHKQPRTPDTPPAGDPAAGRDDGQHRSDEPEIIAPAGLDEDSVDAAFAGEGAEYRQLRADLEEMKDRALRTQAELENYRKRVTRQMDDERRYAELGLLRDLLPIWDNIQRAIEAAEKAGEAPGLLQGFQMVARQLADVLQRHHCEKIEALHQPFDPHLHEAISQQPSAEWPMHTVIHVAQEGFRLHDRVVRPSQVIVAMAPSDAGGG